MNRSLLAAFFSDHHHAHNPSNSSERPARADILLAELTNHPAAGICGAVDFGLEPILEIHDAQFINFLQTAYDRFAALRGEPQPALPDSFAVRELAGRVPRSVWGQLGHYCTDSLTPILEHTWPAAYWSAQVALSAAQAVSGGDRLAYALCRPPGHHAYAAMYGGYCYLNNAAIAAKWLTNQDFRVAILDTDYHHGNGTQAIFYDRHDVFVASLHADPEDEYPYFVGYADEQGVGAGAGYNLNLPLPLGTRLPAYLAALDQALEAIGRFAPDVLIVSHGFDTVTGDPDGGFSLTAADFEAIGRRLRELDRPMLVVQEGGYLLESLASSMRALLAGLMS